MYKQHPKVLGRPRAEHDAVFGEDISTASQQLNDRPELINQIPYTLAVTKEILRLYPPASALREGQPGESSCRIKWDKVPDKWVSALGPSWVHPAQSRLLAESLLLPSRSMASRTRHAWRVFELGPRGCIGQSLAMLDVKITLVLTLREFEFQDQYAELDWLHPKNGLKTVFGERAYQIASHPADGMPCRVTQRESTISA
ncbi:cytochrome protein [Penicillium sp. IBT 35674x]|nr:cytochrome protein [Penicillium sp. IBT 35674x]